MAGDDAEAGRAHEQRSAQWQVGAADQLVLPLQQRTGLCSQNLFQQYSVLQWLACLIIIY